MAKTAIGGEVKNIFKKKFIIRREAAGSSAIAPSTASDKQKDQRLETAENIANASGKKMMRNLSDKDEDVKVFNFQTTDHQKAAKMPLESLRVQGEPTTIFRLSML